MVPENGKVHVVEKDSWKTRGVGKFEMKQKRMKLENFELLYYCTENFPTPMGTYQLKWKLSNFKLSN